MIFRVGRRGFITGALVVSFITPVPPATTTSIHEVQYRPSVRLEVKHITPSGAAPTTTSIKRVQYRPDIRFEVRHITPVDVIDVIGEIPGSGSGRKRGTSPRYRAMRDDQDIIEMLAAWISNTRN